MVASPQLLRKQENGKTEGRGRKIWGWSVPPSSLHILRGMRRGRPRKRKRISSSSSRRRVATGEAALWPDRSSPPSQATTLPLLGDTLKRTVPPLLLQERDSAIDRTNFFLEIFNPFGEAEVLCTQHTALLFYLAPPIPLGPCLPPSTQYKRRQNLSLSISLPSGLLTPPPSPLPRRPLN